jgi:hypothetical protein
MPRWSKTILPLRVKIVQAATFGSKKKMNRHWVQTNLAGSLTFIIFEAKVPPHLGQKEYSIYAIPIPLSFWQLFYGRADGERNDNLLI